MNSDLNTSNNALDKKSELFKCAGKFCENKAIYCLQIKYVNKSGWFCSNCAKDLEQNGFVKHLITKIS
jgi:hypothetical protein